VTPAQIDGVEPGRKHALRVTLDGWQPWETRFVLTDTSRPLEFEALLRKAPASKPVARTTRVARPESPAQPALQVVVADAKGKGKGSVLVASQPPRAEIHLDGIRTGKRTPATLRGVPAGLLHAVQVSLTGHAPAQKTVKPARNRLIKVQLVLKKGAQEESGAGAVTLDSFPKGAVVLVNGKRQKQLTPVTLTLSTLSKLEVRHKGYKPWRRAVSPVQGVNLAYTAHLKRR
jgi:hypothetical protein